MDNRNSAIGVYPNHREAVKAVRALKEAGLDDKQISLLGKADVVDGELNAFSADKAVNIPITIGAVAGSVLGVLAGIGITAIPGFGPIYGAGAIVGAIGGFDIGIMGGGVFSLLLTVGLTKNDIKEYKQQLKEGKHLVIFHGNADDVKKSKEIMLHEKPLIAADHYQ